jgi:hypothetical protein
MTKKQCIFITSTFYCRAIVKQDHYVTHFLIYVNTVYRGSRCKINRYVAAPTAPADRRSLSPWPMVFPGQLEPELDFIFLSHL